MACGEAAEHLGAHSLCVPVAGECVCTCMCMCLFSPTLGMILLLSASCSYDICVLLGDLLTLSGDYKSKLFY